MLSQEAIFYLNGRYRPRQTSWKTFGIRPPGARYGKDSLSANQAMAQALIASPERARAILNFLIFSPISLEKICRRPELLGLVESRRRAKSEGDLPAKLAR